MTIINSFFSDNRMLLDQGLSFLEDLLPSEFSYVEPPLFHSSIGAHFRHVIDHYDAFISGVLPLKIDYDSRNRDLALETDLDICKTKILSLSSQLNGMVLEDRDVFVSSNVRDSVMYAASTFSRELKFLESHTVHHFALIAFIGRYLGKEIPQEFGVAPSTLVYQRLKVTS